LPVLFFGVFKLSFYAIENYIVESRTLPLILRKHLPLTSSDSSSAIFPREIDKLAKGIPEKKITRKFFKAG
jgi:hypothetical protein